jgi:hypothetical protein
VPIRRRELLQGLASGLAGAVAAPSTATFASEAEPQSAAAAPETSHAGILDEPGRALLAHLAARMVPGSEAAGVVELVDRWMAVESMEDRRTFLNALAAFEREARFRHGRGWLELDEPLQHEILAAASTLAPSRPERIPWTKGQPIEPEPPALVDDRAGNLRDHFDRLRDVVARAFYATEPGMKELGFTGRMAWSSLPGCAHPGGDHR